MPASAAPSAPPSVQPTPSEPVPGGWSFVRRERCPESRFRCVTLSVPRDHFVEGGPTWEITFAIQRASGRRLGTFVVITGGPGTSGISVADGYTDAYPPSIARHHDIVYLDQRGIGLSQPFECPEAAVAYYADDARPQDPAQAEAVGAAAATFVERCLAEAGVPEADLPLYATRQAVEDLEAIRDYLGAEKLHLYGESYGTQYVQAYATSHPDRIATLYLDGPVDLTLDAASYYAEAARAFDDTLLTLLTECAASRACAADFEGQDPVDAYEALYERLERAAVGFEFVTADGTAEARELTVADLENATAGYLYSPGDRFLLLRALAAAADDNLAPLARLAYFSIGLDPDSLEVDYDPGYSDAMYYAVECQDYVYNAGIAAPDARRDAFLQTARTLGVDRLRLGTVLYSDMPCIYWPNQPAADPRPPPIVNPPYPTIILVATADPITPVANAIRLASRLSDAHLFLTVGGPHVTFGWGERCPDQPIARYLVEGTLPAGRVTVCENVVSDEYVPIAPDSAADVTDARSFLVALDDHILNTNDYWYRYDAEEALAIGCDFGGTLTYRPTDAGTVLDLDACAFTDGLAVTGRGVAYDATGRVSLRVTVDGDRLRYVRRGNGSVLVLAEEYLGLGVEQPTGASTRHHSYGSP
jgi:pimeloyl-ACP methyl ester carboxylesterase